MLKLPFRMINLKIIISKLLPHLPGANELSIHYPVVWQHLPFICVISFGWHMNMFARGISCAFWKWHVKFRFFRYFKTSWCHWLLAAWYDRRGKENGLTCQLVIEFDTYGTNIWAYVETKIVHDNYCNSSRRGHIHRYCFCWMAKISPSDVSSHPAVNNLHLHVQFMAVSCHATSRTKCTTTRFVGVSTVFRIWSP